MSPLTPAELEPALARVLTPPGEALATGRQHVAGFLDYLRASRVDWQGWYTGSIAQPAALVLALLLPGRTCILMLPTPGDHGIDPAAQRELTRDALQHLREPRMHYAQVLLEPWASSKAALIVASGFRRLASLVYLERDVSDPRVAPPHRNGVTWLPYGPDTHTVFTEVVQATYVDSIDCPELTGLRPIEDILASHKASGSFEPRLWELLLLNDQPVACLLLASLMQGALIEIVYMGVVPTARRQGFAALALQRALQQARTRRAQRLTVVVDSRNRPARQLYSRFSLSPVARRDAYLYRWEPT